CELVPLDDMFENGTVINKKLIRKPKSLRTAVTLATQIAAQISSFTYGGQTMSVSHLAPYVRISKEKIHKQVVSEGLDNNVNYTDEQIKNIINARLKDEIKDSVQTFNYQLSTLNSTNGQSPFLSLAMYINENPEYEEETAMLVEEFLKQRIEGMENEFGVKSTQTFPKLLFFLDEDNINPKSKYYYLKQLAIKSVSKRMNPDFISVKKMKEIHGHAYPCIN
ncbi:MAG: anaerobic ribonucleoside-triphosphate reductase, partial [Sarcina sp.]